MRPEDNRLVNLYSQNRVETPEKSYKFKKDPVYGIQTSPIDRTITSENKPIKKIAHSIYAAPNSNTILSTASQLISRRKNPSMSNVCMGVQKIKKENEQLKNLLKSKKEDKSMALDMYRLLIKKLHALNTMHLAQRK